MSAALDGFMVSASLDGELSLWHDACGRDVLDWDGETDSTLTALIEAATEHRCPPPAETVCAFIECNEPVELTVGGSGYCGPHGLVVAVERQRG